MKFSLIKVIMGAALTALLAKNAFAGALDSDVRATRVKNKIRNAVMAIEGVNAIGVTGCDPQTGKMDLQNDFVHCVIISAHLPEAYEYLSQLYPSRTKIDGVYIVVEKRDQSTAQPRMGGGN